MELPVVFLVKNVSYKATVCEIVDFYKEVSISLISEITKGAFRLEINVLADAITFFGLKTLDLHDRQA